VHPIELRAAPSIFEDVSRTAISLLAAPSHGVARRYPSCELKMTKVARYEMTPHPVEFEMYYSL
jgi:hypothetical protein